MNELHPDAPTRTKVLPWRIMEEIEHTHCWHEIPAAELQCCRCDTTNGREPSFVSDGNKPFRPPASS